MALATVILTPTGAVLVALLTARTTDRRQERALEAEHGRLGLQLAHDRELVDLAELRVLLDDAAATTFGLIEKVAGAWASADAWYDAEPDSSEAHDAQEQTARIRSEAFRIVWPMEALHARLVLRLGAQHTVVQAFVAFHGAARAAVSAIPIEKRPSSRGKTGWAKGHVESLRDTRSTFIERAQKLTGSRLG